MPSRHPLVLICVAALGAACVAVSCGGEDRLFPDDFESTYTVVSNGGFAVADCVNSIDHDANHVRIFVSPGAEVEYCNATPTTVFAEGTIVVKMQYDDDECTELVGYTAMRKEAAGFNPDTDDWNFQRLRANMRVVATGPIAECVNCHGAGIGDCTVPRDYTCLDIGRRLCP